MANGKYYPYNGGQIFVYNPKNAIEWALSKQGAEYEWGQGSSRSSNKWDCSHFVCSAFFNGALYLSTSSMATLWRGRSAPPGFKYGNVPTRDSPKGTILVQRHQEYDPQEGLIEAGHTAIYIGEGETIEAMSEQYGVRKGSLSGRFSMAFEPLQGSLYIANWQQNYIPSWVNSNN